MSEHTAVMLAVQQIACDVVIMLRYRSQRRYVYN
jgi:hypothetical protein